MAPHPPAAPPAGSATQLGFTDLGTPLFDTTFVVLDLETTGLSAERDRITEIGAVKVRGGVVLGELQTFVHPGCLIPAGVTAITGITDAMVRDAPTIGAVLPSVLAFLGDAVFVAHNAGFDLAFLRAAADRAHLPAPEPVVIDTARLGRRLLRDEVRDVRLTTLAAHLRSRVRPDHRALTDARATADVLHGLIERAGPLGATTLEDLRELTRSRSDRAFRRIGLVHDAPRAPGVYRFLDARGHTIYVGKATDLRSRLRSYFGQDPRRRVADLLRETDRVVWHETTSLLEAEVRELRAIQTESPRYNRRSTRPRAACHVALTVEPFPRLVVTRAPGRSHRQVTGPFASPRAAEALVVALQDLTAIRACTSRLRLAQDHPACVLKDLGRCPAPCDGTVDRASYHAVVEEVAATLADPARLLVALRDRMRELADRGRYEQASEVRARLHRIARALEAARRARALAQVDRLVARRDGPDGTEIVTIERGRLASVGHLPRGVHDAEVPARVATVPTTPVDTPMHEHGDEELTLLDRWLGDPAVQLVEVRGTFASDRDGGAEITAVAAEARTVARRLHRDRQLLDRRKVVRRA